MGDPAIYCTVVAKGFQHSYMVMVDYHISAMGTASYCDRNYRPYAGDCCSDCLGSRSCAGRRLSSSTDL